MPFGTASPIAVNGALFQAGFRTGGLQVATGVFGPTTAVPSANSTLSFIRPGNGEIIYSRVGGGGGANIATAGPVANGRDQAGAFPNDSLVHIYNISDGFNATQAIASLSPPFAAPPLAAEVTRNISTMLLGPTLPPGFLFWNYAGCVLMNGANLRDGMYEKDHFMFAVPPNLVNSAAASANFNLLTSMRNAYGIESVDLNIQAALTTNAGGAASSDLRLEQFAFGGAFIMPVSVGLALATDEQSAQVKMAVHSIPASGTNFAFSWINDVNPGNIAARNFRADLAAFRCAFSLKD